MSNRFRLNIWPPVLVCLLLVQNLWAQKADTSYSLPGISITAFRVTQMNDGNRVILFDSAALAPYRSMTAAQALDQLAPVTIRHYGPSGLASISLRGTGASHTAILWRGFNLQSAANGQLDLNLLPIAFAGRLRLQQGGAGALFGSGAVGGVLHLESEPQFNSGLKIGAGFTAGSFGRWQPQIDVSWGGPRWYGSLRAYFLQSKNDFKYPVSLNGKESLVNETSAAERHVGVLAEQALRLGKNQVLSFDVWYQNSDRQLPRSVADQLDRNLRSAITWNLRESDFEFQVRTAFLGSQNHYIDTISGIDSPNQLYSWKSEATATWHAGRGHTAHLAVMNSWDRVESVNFEQSAFAETRQAILAGWRFRLPSGVWSATVNLRQGWFRGQPLPLAPSLGLQGRITDDLSWRVSGSRVYRIPTLNDRYWRPGGQINLRPENGWRADAGLDWKVDLEDLTIEGDAGIFAGRIQDWIIWLPGSGGIWSPANVQLVWNRGLETDFKVQWGWGSLDFTAEAGYGLTLATQEQARFPRDEAVGKQLIYVPLHQGRAAISASGANWQVTYRHQVQSITFTSSDNQNWLPARQLGNLFMEWRPWPKRSGMQLFLRVDNLWGLRYESVPGFPMPGRQFLGGINYVFKP